MSVQAMKCILTVGTYSEGNLFVVYEMSKHVLPTAPSPTTTHLIVCMVETRLNAMRTTKFGIYNHNGKTSSDLLKKQHKYESKLELKTFEEKVLGTKHLM